MEVFLTWAIILQYPMINVSIHHQVESGRILVYIFYMILALEETMAEV